MPAKLKSLFASLPESGIDRNNAISTFLMGALPAVGGSIISVMFGVFFVWGAISLALRRFEFKMTRGDRFLAWTFTSFAGLIIATAAIGQNLQDAPRSVIWVLVFLAPWILIPRLRASPKLDYLNLLVLGAAVGAIAGCLIAFMQLMITGIRPAAGAGNAAVFAIMSLCLMGLGGLNIDTPSKWRKFLAIAAVFVGALAIVFSMTRGVATIVIPMLLLLVAYAPAAWRSALWRPSTLVIVIGVCLAVYAVQQALDMRLQQTFDEFRLVMEDQNTSSIGERLRLWDAALNAVSRSPIIGYGVQNRMDVLAPILRQDGQSVLGFSHAHNGFLSSALDGGIFVLVAVIGVLAAPVVLAWRARRDKNHRLRLFAALAVTGTYTLCGLTQIMFKHDIMDGFFVFFSILIAASIPEDAPGLS